MAWEFWMEYFMEKSMEEVSEGERHKAEFGRERFWVVVLIQ